MSKTRRMISDHALMRWMERRHAFDFARYRDEMMTPALRRAIRMGMAIHEENNMVFKIAEGVVVTCYPIKIKEAGPMMQRLPWPGS